MYKSTRFTKENKLSRYQTCGVGASFLVPDNQLVHSTAKNHFHLSLHRRSLRTKQKIMNAYFISFTRTILAS